ncbi:MAG: hypothetical protein CVV64_19245 [Candidatus Wallbacteria bacterium HGW-Wallbacteria-1]|jgi:hypothetical protein|uniref:Uncharacterized protein n=1 Tax=Candidatus Wallbacteria bacterium HGW-Wallbacteria-1 TaxID=2013854 RepID=A0A2N1PJ41_9BACT|nr:MAG: hypothetical protein CVV64_19245 [Candidatus Wallbacteria bacterium HGW-Wallbacteria-1]
MKKIVILSVLIFFLFGIFSFDYISSLYYQSVISSYYSDISNIVPASEREKYQIYSTIIINRYYKYLRKSKELNTQNYLSSKCYLLPSQIVLTNWPLNYNDTEGELLVSYNSAFKMDLQSYRELVTDYKAETSENIKFEPGYFPFAKKIRYLDSSILTKKDFDVHKDVYDKFPDSIGLTAFSGIGFSRDRKFAIVKYYHIVDSLFADSCTMLLIKENQKWRILEEFTGTIS